LGTLRPGAKITVPNKTAEFEVKNSANARKKLKQNICYCYIEFFLDINKTRLALETHSTKL